MTIPEDLVISRTRLANGATLTKLRPVPRDDSTEITARPGRGKLLVRYGDMTIALNASERQSWWNERANGHTVPPKPKKGTQHG